MIFVPGSSLAVVVTVGATTPAAKSTDMTGAFFA